MNQVILDQAVLDELRDATGEAFLAELIETFLTEAPGMIGELEQAADTGDQEALRRAAHSIKSNANTFGATALADLARDMELSGDSAGFTDLKAAFDQAAAALGAVLNG